MELAAVLNLLWARRIAVGFGVLLAIGAGLVEMPGRPSGTGSAMTARLLVDTKPSELVSARTARDALADPLPIRAALLAEVMAADQFRSLLARQSGVQEDQLDVLPPSSGTTPTDSLITQKAATLAAVSRGPYVLRLQADETTPLISIETEAPDPADASRLATASITVLQSSLASKQEGQGPPVVVRTIASPQRLELVGHTGRRAVAVATAFAVFTLWCGGIILASGIARRMRRPLPV